jgi:hypothetical protein
MANTKAGNVYFFDTTAGTIPGPAKIGSVKYIGNTSGTAAITAGTGGSGNPVWQESGTSNQAAEEICAFSSDGFYIALTNSAKIYVYLE